MGASGHLIATTTFSLRVGKFSEERRYWLAWLVAICLIKVLSLYCDMRKLALTNLVPTWRGSFSTRVFFNVWGVFQRTRFFFFSFFFPTYFIKHVQTHNYPTRNVQDYSINKTKKMFSDCAVINCGPSFWNSLDKTLNIAKPPNTSENSLNIWIQMISFWGMSCVFLCIFVCL